MAYPVLRSMNAELSEGATDGKYKKIVANRGGPYVGETCTVHARLDLHDKWFGLHEEEYKVRPDGRAVKTPNYVRTPLSNC